MNLLFLGFYVAPLIMSVIGWVYVFKKIGIITMGDIFLFIGCFTPIINIYIFVWYMIDLSDIILYDRHK